MSDTGSTDTNPGDSSVPSTAPESTSVSESSSSIDTTETSTSSSISTSSSTPDPPSSSSTTPPPSTDPTSASTTPPPSSSTLSPPPESSSSTSTPPTESSSSSSVSSSASPSVTLPSSTSSPLPQSSSSSSDAVQTTVPPSSTATSGPLTSIDQNGSVVTGNISISTDAQGRKYTVTVFQTSTASGSLDGGSGSSHGGSGFFDNTGAVAGVFAVVGLLVASGLALFAWYMLRRRRRQRLDRDVAAAAAAAAASHHPRFEDDDEPSMTQYNSSGGYYASHSSHEFDQQPQMHQYEYEDPSGGYDPYAANLVDVPPIANGDRPISTATAAGLAGFGASSAAANYYGGAEQDYGHETDFSQPQHDYAQHDYAHSYGDPQYDIAHQYAVPNSTLSPVTEMSAEGHPGSEHHDMYAAYGGYSYNDDAEFAQQPQQQHSSQFDNRPLSVASVEQPRPRDLTVSNV